MEKSLSIRRQKGEKSEANVGLPKTTQSGLAPKKVSDTYFFQEQTCLTLSTLFTSKSNVGAVRLKTSSAIALFVDRPFGVIQASKLWYRQFARWKNGMVDYFQELSFRSVAFSIYWAYLADQTLKKKQRHRLKSLESLNFKLQAGVAKTT